MNFHSNADIQKAHAVAGDFGPDSRSDAFAENRLRLAVILGRVAHHLTAWREGWQDGNRLYQDAKGKWPLIEL